MTRRNKLLIGFFIIVLVPVITVWVLAWPILRPWNLPEAIKGEMVQPQERSLMESEIQHFNQWLASHRTGWGTRGEQPPGQDIRPTGVLILYSAPTEAKKMSEYRFFYWHFRHGESVVGIEQDKDGPYRMRSLEKKDEKALKMLFSTLSQPPQEASSREK